MGSGAPRELQGQMELKPLEDKVVDRLEKALEQLDERNPDFGQGRADERAAQSVKIWGRTTKRMENDLRALGEVFNASNQLSLDMGIDGGGGNATPWLGESNGVIPRLEFKMKDMKVSAICEGRVLGTIHLKKVDYDWIEKMAVTWLIVQAEQR